MAASQNRGAFVSYWAGPPKNPGPASRFTAVASLARLFGRTGRTMLNFRIEKKNMRFPDEREPVAGLAGRTFLIHFERRGNEETHVSKP